MITSTDPPTLKAGCSNCVLRGFGLCSLLIDLGLEQPHPDKEISGPQQLTNFTARRTIFREDQTLPGVPIVCEGWAASILTLSNGRRQILSILLPGEMVTGRMLFERRLHFSIESITQGSYRTFDLPQVRAAISGSRDIFDKLMLAYNEERNRADQLIADLGRRTATGRIARLILDLWTRLEKTGQVADNCIAFPLRHTHIADATGLTTVYVSKVINDFRKDSLVDVTGRSLKILDIEKLRMLAA
ncbi:MAG: Crp/Fnr family transcriptional regulator [Pseudolabrys sp.]|nr:Crp/Fnr family transcriptional regulator [Pseudolabrys sp.]